MLVLITLIAVLDCHYITTPDLFKREQKFNSVCLIAMTIVEVSISAFPSAPFCDAQSRRSPETFRKQ